MVREPRHPKRTRKPLASSWDVFPQTNDNCPLRHSPADCYRGSQRPVTPREGGTSYPAPSPPSTVGMEGNGRKWKRIKSFATPGSLLTKPRAHPCPVPDPNPRPGRSAHQTTTTRQLAVADMPKNEYDDSNAAARPRFRPVARVTHLHTPQAPVPKVPTSVARPTPTRSDPGRSQGTPPEPVPVPATQSRRWRHRLPSFP